MFVNEVRAASGERRDDERIYSDQGQPCGFQKTEGPDDAAQDHSPKNGVLFRLWEFANDQRREVVPVFHITF
jgi:hypothetical protein